MFLTDDSRLKNDISGIFLNTENTGGKVSKDNFEDGNTYFFFFKDYISHCNCFGRPDSSASVNRFA